MKRIFLLLVPFLLVAGCAKDTAEPGAPGTSGGPSGTNETVNPFKVPLEWTKGRWWKYSFQGGTASDPVTLMVTEVQSAVYVLDTTSRMQAGFDAETDVSYIGPITKDQLAGAQQGRKVEYFKFPLEVKKEWSTQWDGQTRIIKSMGATGDEFEFEAHELGKARVRYSYHAKAGFFGHLDFVDAGGNVGFGLKLMDFGESYAGPYVRATVKALITPIDIKDQPSQNTNAQDFKVEAGVSEMVLRYDVKCNPSVGSWELTVKPKDPAAAQTDGYQDSSPPSTCTKALNKTIDKPKAGDWVFDSKAALVTGPNYMRVSLIARTFQDLTM